MFLGEKFINGLSIHELVDVVILVGQVIDGFMLWRFNIEVNFVLLVEGDNRSILKSPPRIMYRKWLSFSKSLSRQSMKVSKLERGLFDRYIQAIAISRLADVTTVYSKLKRTGSRSRVRGRKS
uniref:Uncharacterized protein n=1 Tax=Cacopsylla melanoneura TaxID=428564 RepID=A0A8D8R8Q2_9HEMI